MKKLFLTLSVALLTASVACSSSDPVAAADADVVNVDVGGTAGDAFSPTSTTIKVGQTIRWTWRGGSHNVVSGTDCSSAGDGKFRSGAPVEGGTFDFKFEVAGQFPYYCELHCAKNNMKGVIIVQ
jgi:plastocyanin